MLKLFSSIYDTAAEKFNLKYIKETELKNAIKTEATGRLRVIFNKIEWLTLWYTALVSTKSLRS
jgi:hypothetical protein